MTIVQEVKTTNYLIIGNIHQGYDSKILRTLSNYAELYKANVIHLGAVISDKIIKLYNKAKDEEDRQYYLTEQRENIQVLHDVFPNIKFICNPTQYITDKQFKNKILDENEYLLGDYLLLSCIPASGERVSYSPITKRVFNFFKDKKFSVVTPHSTPIIKSFPKSGLNQASVIFSTGCLHTDKEVLKTNQMYKNANMPSAILIQINEDTKTFHSKRIHFDDIYSSISGRKIPHILDDGYAISMNEIIEVGSEGIAVMSADKHGPFQNNGTLACERNLIAKSQPNTYIDMGDTVDFQSICHHNKNQPLLKENLRLKYDLNTLKYILDTQTNYECIKERVLIDSNHHEWLTKYVEERPELDGILDWCTVQKDYLPKWKVIHRKGDTEIYTFGDIVIRHGDREGGLAKGEAIFGKYICGHWHSWQEIKRSGSVGTACNTDLEYLEGNQTSWINTIVLLTKYKNITNFNIKVVLHQTENQSTYAWRDKIYKISY